MSEVLFKRSDDVLDYDVDFSRWLASDDAIISTEAEIEGSAAIDAIANSSSVVKLWISGGTIGETCHVTTRATTSGGRTKEHCFRLRIRDNC